MSLPFKLYKNHKSNTKCSWKRNGLKESDEFIEDLYNRYIVATHCELCNNEFISSQDRRMDHCHKTGEFRNIVCSSCNNRKHDVKMRSHNTSGYKGISKHKCKTINQGFTWRFQVSLDGKLKVIKSSIDYDKLVAFADQWKLDNNYYT